MLFFPTTQPLSRLVPRTSPLTLWWYSSIRVGGNDSLIQLRQDLCQYMPSVVLCQFSSHSLFLASDGVDREWYFISVDNSAGSCKLVISCSNLSYQAKPTGILKDTTLGQESKAKKK
jgi:hypothetical protein